MDSDPRKQPFHHRKKTQRSKVFLTIPAGFVRLAQDKLHTVETVAEKAKREFNTARQNRKKAKQAVRRARKPSEEA